MGKNSAKANAAKPARSLMRRTLRMLAISFGLWLILTVSLVLAYRWVNPPITGIRLYRAVMGVTSSANKNGGAGKTEFCWMNLQAMGPNLPMAIIASEDQRFNVHHGFDFTELSQAMKSKGRKRGASTITQQVAKNVFLWPGRSYVRKALEAYFALLIEALWSKRRILEVYINVIEFGDAIYGGCAGAKVAFSKVPAQLSPYQAALLATSLPNPHLLSAQKPTQRMSRRAGWIVRQMGQLGGAGYLARL